jgi:hypothetical protein
LSAIGILSRLKSEYRDLVTAIDQIDTGFLEKELHPAFDWLRGFVEAYDNEETASPS